MEEKLSELFERSAECIERLAKTVAHTTECMSQLTKEVVALRNDVNKLIENNQTGVSK